jgi:hypothetical protein
MASKITVAGVRANVKEVLEYSNEVGFHHVSHFLQHRPTMSQTL